MISQHFSQEVPFSTSTLNRSTGDTSLSTVIHIFIILKESSQFKKKKEMHLPLSFHHLEGKTWLHMNDTLLFRYSETEEGGVQLT